MKQKQELETNETVHEAIKKLLSIEKEVSDLEDALIRLRFAQGMILKPFSDLSAEEKYGKNILQNISTKTHISTGILRIAENIADMFEYDEQKLHNTLAQLRRDGKKLSVSFLLGRRNPRPKNSLSEESIQLEKEQLLRSAERGAEALEVAKKEYGSEDDEVRGVEMAFSEALLGSKVLIGDGRIYAPVNWTEYHNPRYEEFLSEQPCCITGTSPVTLLHWAFTEEGKPASDFLTLPIDESLVPEFNELGPAAFFNKYQLKPVWACLDYVQRFVAEVSEPF